jgi:hypothetical protein
MRGGEVMWRNNMNRDAYESHLAIVAFIVV